MWISLGKRINTAFLKDLFKIVDPLFLLEMVEILSFNGRMKRAIVINTVVERARYRALKHKCHNVVLMLVCQWSEPVIGH